MHREISHTDDAFAEESNSPLYLMTGLLAALMALELLPRLGDWAGWSLFASWPREPFGYRYGFAMAAAILGGARVVYIALQGLFDGKIGADIAIAIAFLAAILIQEWLVAAEVVFIGMFGECLEAFTFDRTRSAIRKLVEVFPLRCWVLRDGQETRVFTRDVVLGDRVVVKPGAKVPVDGIVIDGRSTVDTSALTGESLPIDKIVGDEVLAGSINQTGALTIEAKRVAQQTVAGRVIELTAKALKDKSNLERNADRLARLFLPAVLGVALLTFLACALYFGTTWLRPAGATRLALRQVLTLAAYPTLSVLVVACPCALILATPAAIIAALGRLAGTGVLIKSGAALERLAGVRAFAFDKTGTITEAKLEIGDIVPMEGVDPIDLLRTAASGEQQSEHPLARLIVGEAAKRGVALKAVEDFQAQPGAGVIARTDRGEILIGNRRLLAERNVTIPPAADEALGMLDAKGQTALLVARDGVVLGAIGARDTLRPGAVGLLNHLREIGIDPIVLLTGDRTAAAKAIALDLPFSEIHAELLPDQKAQFLAAMQSAGTPVAMVGDGINDAPALAGASVGIAIGSTGTDIAAEAGDIVLMGDPLKHLPFLVRLARETVKIINQNIIWFAYVVNAVGIVGTAWLWPLFAPEGWYEQSPIAAVIYHQLGSFLVLLNSLRILWFERSEDSPAWQAWVQRLKGADDWIGRNLNIGEAIHWCEHHWQRIAMGAMAVGMLVYACSGFTIVASDEVGIVRRFGNPVGADLTPGWYLRWPWPIESTTRVSQRIRTLSIGFKEQPERASTTGALTWSSAHRKETRIGEEAMMITGDNSLADLLVSVRYSVARPRVFLFAVTNPEETIKAIAESELRAMVAGQSFPELMTSGRGKFQADVLARIRARCDALVLGVAIESVAIVDLHPPGEVVPAYYAVANAMEDRDRKINEADEEVTKKLKDADAEVVKILAKAKASRAEKVEEARQERERFFARFRPRLELGSDAELELAFDAAADLFTGNPIDDVWDKAKKRRRDLLELQAPLVEFAIYWETIGKALSRRDLLLIDSDKIAGRRNLMLFDPELFRAPPPILLPPNRMPQRFPEQKGEDP